MTQAAFFRGIELAQGCGDGAAAEVAAAVQAAVDGALAAPAQPRACAAGCSWCCRHVVGVSFAEAVALAQAIALLPDPVAAQVRAALRAQAEAARTWDELARAPQPCPLLVADRCAVYSVRPVPCRSLFSADAAACRDDADGAQLPHGVPFDGEAHALGLGAAHALAGIATRRGWPAEPRELRLAVSAVLTALPRGLPAMTAAFLAARSPRPSAGGPRGGADDRTLPSEG